jgi:hypothetical protein
VTLVVVVNVVSGRGSEHGGLSHLVVALGSISRSGQVEAVVDLHIQNFNLVFDGQVGHLNVQAVVVNALYTGVNGCCQSLFADVSNAILIGPGASLVEFPE